MECYNINLFGFTCTKCETGYQIYNDYCQSCKDFNSGCLECSDNKCSKCSSGYFLENNKCVSCQSRWGSECKETCTNNGCNKCGGETEGKITIGTDGKCVTCEERFGIECDRCNDHKCMKCVDDLPIYYDSMTESCKGLFYSNKNYPKIMK